MQYGIKLIFSYFVNNFLALIYTIYVTFTNYVPYCIIFGEVLLQMLRGLLFPFSCRQPYLFIKCIILPKVAIRIVADTENVPFRNTYSELEIRQRLRLV